MTILIFLTCLLWFATAQILRPQFVVFEQPPQPFAAQQPFQAVYSPGIFKSGYPYGIQYSPPALPLQYLQSPYTYSSSQVPLLPYGYPQFRYPSMYGVRPVVIERKKEGNEFRDDEGAFEEEDDEPKNNKPSHVLRPKIPPVSLLDHAEYLPLINDKDNFQASGCSFDIVQQKCVDNIGLCKGGCKDFAVSNNVPIHDCRCIPYGYAALLKLAG